MTDKRTRIVKFVKGDYGVQELVSNGVWLTVKRDFQSKGFAAEWRQEKYADEIEAVVG